MQRRLGDTRGAGVATQRVTTHSPGRARRERQVLGEDAWYSVCEWTLDGAAQFDDLATAVIHDNPDAADVFNSVISLTPTPALQRTGSGSSDHSPSADLLKREGLRDRVPWRPQNTFVTFTIPPPDVKSDREHLFKAAHDRILPVERIQYSWEGQRLFYDPDKLPNLYMAH
ncbi:hypothetical protein PC129_g14419 [Phytophthora cactorum]|uniref:Uncharacterized protein n=1 Tax=Phytophthora cactorum TaxID=29920 RepID=A0A329SBP7_9STRA|nr:hypothetical protein Pcac1_g17161 [Phytophthora cactorum]KAG2890136.1 hypothetical protein PC114_g17629 [Phytophthora cactorum]KAG2902750.1 hypothetical protein PC115_g15517 [Phytophthora cactorum]KAG2918857.1 hypothetical protein PC117_g16938 [Phytophthora cactorum]KAG3000431.1 hypothetical protein PC119_g17009 [Phytophthora cactorum]